jgi:hypothetical protein
MIANFRAMRNQDLLITVCVTLCLFARAGYFFLRAVASGRLPGFNSPVRCSLLGTRPELLNTRNLRLRLG